MHPSLRPLALPYRQLLDRKRVLSKEGKTLLEQVTPSSVSHLESHVDLESQLANTNSLNFSDQLPESVKFQQAETTILDVPDKA